MEPRRTKHALVIGGRGVLGALTVRAFRAAGWAVRSGTRRPGPQETEIDLDREDSVADALQGQDLVINTVPHRDLLAERHVLKQGGTLINVSGLPAAAARSLRATAGCARGTVLMNAGLAPGVTTLVAADLLRRHPDASELEIVFTVSVTDPRGPASIDFVHRGLTASRRHRTAVVPLPSPFGERRCLGFAEDDAGWVGGIGEGRVIRQYICVAESALHQLLLELNALGAMDGLPRSLIAPPGLSRRATGAGGPVTHWVAALRAGGRLSAQTVECRGDALHAARSTVVFAEALRTQARGGGCFDPEEIFTLSRLATKLQAVGIRIVTQTDSALEGRHQGGTD